MRHYNGFSPDERKAAGAQIAAAVNAGKLIAPTSCLICGARHRKLGWHLEDYGHPLTAIRVCWICHRGIHRRFWRADTWPGEINPLLTAWPFLMALSMDPESMERRIELTYPAGAPKL